MVLDWATSPGDYGRAQFQKLPSLEIFGIATTGIILLKRANNKDTDWTVTGHFVPRSFRTQVISFHFDHFVPTFIFSLVISYPVGHFVPTFTIF